MDLQYVLSDFKVVSVKNETGSYTDRGLRLDKDDPKGSFLIYVSKEKEQAEKARLLEEKNDHKGLGKALGYPECCCDFFGKHFSSENTDLTTRSFSQLNNPWQTNICLRSFDISLISHFPCSFHCEKTKGIALRNLEVIRKHSIDTLNYFQHALKTAVLYAEGVGVVSIKKFALSDNMILYDPKSVIASVENDLTRMIRDNSSIAISDKNRYIIGKHLVHDDKTFLALFS
ncbi:hypothetical protein GOV09_04025, partial [Candidatus Woesearchaeota archaeon]|nr:hypothetical protein [Candidatus Woesearchaeota archaeon]